MHKQLELLIMLHEMDLLIQEMKSEEEVGFAPPKEELENARENIVQELDKNLYKTYERIRSKCGRAVAPVNNSICYGCFVRMPTSLSGKAGENNEVRTCENCGRFIYWLS